MTSLAFKQQAHQIVDELPPDAGWAELIYQAVLHRAIERGLAEADAGLLVPAEELLKSLEQAG
ncbi:MAG: hypothetical protein QM769_10710 [Pseudoxanthomonas sp.]